MARTIKNSSMAERATAALVSNPATMEDDDLTSNPPLRPGLVSVTFRQLTPAVILDLAARVGLEGIEWGGDVHVPHGELDTAREVRRLTQEAGLQVAAYGSYYRVGHSESEGLSFERVLETAGELSAPLVRVWAGQRAAVDDNYLSHVATDARRIADMAQTAGIRVACEWHEGTLTQTPEGALRLLHESAHPNLRLLWQPVDWLEKSPSETIEANLAGLRLAMPYLENLHVFHWKTQGQQTQRCALREGESMWNPYLKCLAECPAQGGAAHERWLLLEFVRDHNPAVLAEDALTLRQWLRGGSG